MAVEIVKDKNTSSITEVVLGATRAEGGTRTSVVKIGGENCLPFHHFEGAIPNAPAVSMEVWDIRPTEWPESLTKHFGDALSDPGKWAKACVEKYGASTITLRLMGAHPDSGDAKPEQCAAAVKSVLSAVGVPLIVIGSGHDEKDNLILPACSEAAKGEKCLFGNAVQANYKTLAAACLADGHSIITESPIDVNIQKQVNILVGEMGISTKNIVMDPTTGALGYGLEYCYSVMERIRLAALSGDSTLNVPFICRVGQEVWRSKEARATAAERPEWGDENRRGPAWEVATSTSLLMSGANLLVLRHPDSVASLKARISELMVK